MRIQSATYNIVYPECKNIRREVFNLEDKLGGLFIKPFSLIPIPDDAPAEIPRIHATSNCGHSQLSMALNATQFTIQYDDEFRNDSNKCFDYIRERVYKIFDAISSSTNNEYLFSGLTVNVLIDDLIDDPIDIMMKNFYKVQSNEKPFDINNKSTYVLNQKYYVNIEVNNMRQYENISALNINPFADTKQVSHVIGVTLDINDRYAFNYKKGYLSKSEEVESIIDISYSILCNKIERYIKEGVLELDNR